MSDNEIAKKSDDNNSYTGKGKSRLVEEEEEKEEEEKKEKETKKGCRESKSDEDADIFVPPAKNKMMLFHSGDPWGAGQSSVQPKAAGKKRSGKNQGDAAKGAGKKKGGKEEVGGKVKKQKPNKKGEPEEAKHKALERLTVFFEHLEVLTSVVTAMNLVNKKNGCLRCNQDGVFFQSMDELHTVFVDMLLKADKLDDYACSQEFWLHPPIGSLMTLCKLGSNANNATLSAVGSSPRQLSLVFDDPVAESTRNFDLVLNPSFEDDFEFKEIDPGSAAVVRMFSVDLHNICDSLSGVVESSVYIHVHDNVIEFSGRGDNTEAKIKRIDRVHMFDSELFDTVSVSCARPVKLELSLKW